MTSNATVATETHISFDNEFTTQEGKRLSVEHIHHFGGDESFFVSLVDDEEALAFSLTRAQFDLFRDWANRNS